MATINISGLHLRRGEHPRHGNEPAGFFRIASGDVDGKISYDIPFVLTLAPNHDEAVVVQLRQTDEGHAELAKQIQRGVSMMPSGLLTPDELLRISPWLLNAGEVIFTQAWLDAMNPY